MTWSISALIVGWIMLSWVCWVFQQINQLPFSLNKTAFVHVCVHICEVPMQTCSKDIFLELERSMKVKGWIKVWLKRLHLFLKASLLHTTTAVFVFHGAEADGWGHTAFLQLALTGEDWNASGNACNHRETVRCELLY